MNKQGKDGIEWCDFSWNPCTGCLHGCSYCYAAKIYKRFKRSFEPTFHTEKLGEPAKLKKPSKIFVGSTTDLFGEWVPDEWIQEVFKACEAAPQHTYLFLTKNPKRYSEIYRSDLDYYNMWFGTTITDDDSFINNGADLYQSTNFNHTRHANRFLSIEPLLGQIHEVRLHSCLQYIQWVIIGQQTNPDKPPKPEWVQSIIDQCREAGVPVFVKSPLFTKFPIQEWPDGLKKEAEVK